MTTFVLAALITIGAEKSVCPAQPQPATVLERQSDGVYLEVPGPTGCRTVYEEREEEWTATPEAGGTHTKETKPPVERPRRKPEIIVKPRPDR